MYVVIRHSTYPIEFNFIESANFKEFQKIHEQQTGYAGTSITNLGNGHFITFTLWKTEEDMIKARQSLEKVVEKLLNPLMSQQSVLIGTGPMVFNDIPFLFT